MGAADLNRQEILLGLAEILEKVCGTAPEEVAPEMSFADDLKIDDLSMREVAQQAQGRFGVTIPDADVENLKTVGDAISYIERKT